MQCGTLNRYPFPSHAKRCYSHLVGIAENLQAVRERVAAACQRAGRSPDEVTIVGVSKTFPAALVAEACRAGLADVGENRVQEAAEKIPQVEALGSHPRWHLVGHLQTNKVKTALGLFDIIHSVDSLRLAEFISRQTEKAPVRAAAPMSVLLEVNVGGEASKFGFSPEEAGRTLEQIARLPGLVVQGLMTVAPFVDDPEVVRPSFRELRRLRDALGLQHLSMGMTDDFEVAVEEGATMVRIGRAIFGPREPAWEWARPEGE
jgi:pyridoxal phosphate enzyme (YggS family)